MDARYWTGSRDDHAKGTVASFRKYSSGVAKSENYTKVLCYAIRTNHDGIYDQHQGLESLITGTVKNG